MTGCLVVDCFVVDRLAVEVDFDRLQPHQQTNLVLVLARIVREFVRLKIGTQQRSNKGNVRVMIKDA